LTSTNEHDSITLTLKNKNVIAIESIKNLNLILG